MYGIRIDSRLGGNPRDGRGGVRKTWRATWERCTELKEPSLVTDRNNSRSVLGNADGIEFRASH